MVNQIKKTVRLNGHTTSLALEKEFWEELNIIANDQSLSLNKLIEKIDTIERKGSLASSIRVHILNILKARNQ
ncbi:MAG: ribbon-helix-helix domain-containing protein [Alphaproteobacteria bacterium]|jgi:predicted DNA-binding ribbon-helix-helix protein|tara:strand:+ start:924 stop:1142 length:219 start_codon:yes stop_codon:yes gene_type:complete